MFAAMPLDPAQLPDDVATLKAMVIVAEKKAHDRGLEIKALKLTLAKLRRDKFGASSERGAKLIDQLELQLAELDASVAQDEVAAEIEGPLAAPATPSNGDTRQRRKPARRPLPEHLPRERVVHPAPSACPCCGGRLRKLGEDITETLEHVPAQWKVIQHVREKFSCRQCEAITQPPAPSHPIARGRAGPELLAQVLFAKYGAHLPLNRQSEIHAKEGIDLDTSTLADWVGACAATLMPLVEEIAKHVFAAERIHADDTTVPVLAKGKTRTGRLWVYVRDDAPFGGCAPPAAIFHYSPDRGGEHPERHLAGYSGIMQADAYAGFNALYLASPSEDAIGPSLAPILEAGARPPSTPSLKQPNSTTSTPALGSLTCSGVSPITRPIALPSCCPGIGSARGRRRRGQPPDRSTVPCGAHRTLMLGLEIDGEGVAGMRLSQSPRRDQQTPP